MGRKRSRNGYGIATGWLCDVSRSEQTPRAFMASRSYAMTSREMPRPHAQVNWALYSGGGLANFSAASAGKAA
jgi:hypothetical protein